MLLLLFHAGGQGFGLDASRIVEMTPVPNLRPVPSAPEYVAGLFHYRGFIVPVIDVSALLFGRAARLLLSTRIAVVQYRQDKMLGLLVEKATDTLGCRMEDIEPSGVSVEAAPYLGGILRHPSGILQCVTVDDLLPVEVRERLFAQHA